MKFVHAIWKLLVGIKDGLVLLLLIIFFAGLYGALSAKPAPVERTPNPRQSPQARRVGRGTSLSRRHDAVRRST